MILRANWIDITAFLAFQRDVRRLSPKTVGRNEGCLRWLLEWADEIPFPEAYKIRPVFSEWLECVSARRDYMCIGTLSAKTRYTACRLALQFLQWAVSEFPDRYARVPANWLVSLMPKHRHDTGEDPLEPQYYTLEDVRRLLAVEPTSLRIERDQASAALLYLSGARVGAFVTLPIGAIDVRNATIKQWQQLGVETKNGRSATTYLVAIPDLYNVVTAWDAFVRSMLPSECMWYAGLDGTGKNLDPQRSQHTTSRCRRGTVAAGLRDLCKRAEIPYRSPHKLRHGHARYAIALARTIAEFKAISQNLMHADVTVTDSLYNVMHSRELRSVIDVLSHRGQEIDLWQRSRASIPGETYHDDDGGCQTCRPPEDLERLLLHLIPMVMPEFQGETLSRLVHFVVGALTYPETYHALVDAAEGVG